LRIANSVGAVLTNRRVLGDSSVGPTMAGALALLALTVVALIWPAWIAWPVAVLCAWFALNLAIRGWRLHQRQKRDAQPFDEEP
jgi:cardiolipin synthase